MRPIDADSIYPWYVNAFKENKELGFKGIKPNEPRFSMNDIKKIWTIYQLSTVIPEQPKVLKLQRLKT